MTKPAEAVLYVADPFKGLGRGARDTLLLKVEQAVAAARPAPATPERVPWKSRTLAKIVAGVGLGLVLGLAVGLSQRANLNLRTDPPGPGVGPSPVVAGREATLPANPGTAPVKQGRAPSSVAQAVAPGGAASDALAAKDPQLRRVLIAHLGKLGASAVGSPTSKALEGNQENQVESVAGVVTDIARATLNEVERDGLRSMSLRTLETGRWTQCEGVGLRAVIGSAKDGTPIDLVRQLPDGRYRLYLFGSRERGGLVGPLAVAFEGPLSSKAKATELASVADTELFDVIARCGAALK
jgi:hypothetical protein